MKPLLLARRALLLLTVSCSLWLKAHAVTYSEQWQCTQSGEGHTFSIAPASPALGSATLIIDAESDYSPGSTETLEWTIEGIVSGSFGSAAADEAIPHPNDVNVYYIKKTYTISAAEMALITADGEITITLQNSSNVDTGFASTALVFGSDSFRYSLEYQDSFVVFGDFIISLSATVGGGITVAQSGADLTLSALADEGYVFDQWSGDASGSANPLQFVIDADRTILAEFIPDLADTDGDGLSNYAEAILYGSDPNSADPFDSLAGYYEPDRSTEDLDGDGIRNREELGYGSDPNDPTAIPADGITSNLEVSQWDFTYLNHHAARESAVALAAVEMY